MIAFSSPDPALSRVGSAVFATLVALAATLVLAVGASALATPQVTTGNSTTCVVLDTGGVQCWGDNSEGQLGNGTNTTSITPVAVTGLTDVIDVANGDSTNCALLADRTVRCWGADDDGALGDAAGQVDSNVPVVVAGVSDAIQISGIRSSFCALIADGSVKCWGRNIFNQFGLPDFAARETPVVVAGLTAAVKVVASAYNVCAVISGGTVKCLGDNDSGQLGDPAVSTGVDSQTPVNVVGLGGVTDLAGNAEHFCAVVQSGGVKCWGSNWDGELGNGDTTLTNQPSPVDVVGVTGAIGLSDGRTSVCALINDGTVKCWGSNTLGQLGDGSGATSTVPAPVAGLTRVRGISDQTDHGHCAWLSGGALHCWGENDEGQLGIADLNFEALTPTAIPGVDLVTQPWPATAAAASQPIKTKLDKKKKTYTLTTRLTATPHAFVLPAEACGGLVTASVTRSYYVKQTVKVKGKKVKKKVKKYKTYKKTAALTPVGETCSSTLALKLSTKFFNGKKVKVTLSAVGSASLQPVSAQKTVKLPKVKTKKKRAKRK